jgi:hypothetical protein
MPAYTVAVTIILTVQGQFTVRARDADAARQRAEQSIEQACFQMDWHLTTEPAGFTWDAEDLTVEIDDIDEA